MRRNGDIGDGDVCPIAPEHGHMLVLNGKTAQRTQYCPHADHYGRFKCNPRGAAPMTRSLWPLQFFAKAVKEYTVKTQGEAATALPELDLGGLDA